MKNIIKLNESTLRKIVAESVKKVLKEARMGRGTTTTTSSSWSGDEYGGTTNTFYRTEENPYSNDAVMMLADRLEKRLGGEYRVEVHANPYRYEKYDYDSDKTHYKTFLTKVDFVIIRKDGNSDYYIERQNIDDIVTISKVAKQLLSNMAEKVYISNVSCNGESELDTNDSVTVTALLRNVDEPRKDMIPKSRWGKKEDFYEPTPDTGYADSKFTKPQLWHTTEN